MKMNNLIFQSTVRRISKISLKLYIKEEYLTKKENGIIYLTRSRPGIRHGSAKVHKSPSFCPALSPIARPTYNLVKFLVPFLSPLTVNEFTVHDSFSFAKELANFDANCPLKIV